MIEFSGRGILLDIEGTTSSVKFVYDVMFPFARRELSAYLSATWDDDATVEARDLIAKDAGHASFAEWQSAAGIGMDDAAAGRNLVAGEVVRMMDGDVKATGLKFLQGLIWRSGFESGEMQAHVYDDVPPALQVWQAAGRDLRIYSSGSVDAQRLFFGHTIHGDLLPLFSGHYDTTVGPKKVAASYQKICEEFGLPAGEILFLSDVTAELDAAREAGLRTGLCCRPGNKPTPDNGHATLTSFADVQLRTPGS